MSALDALTRRPAEPYDDYIERVATNETAVRVKVADLRENLANNLDLPQSERRLERVTRYERALIRLGHAPD